MIIKTFIIFSFSILSYFLGYFLNFYTQIHNLSYLSSEELNLSKHELAYKILKETDIFSIDYTTLSALAELEERTGLPEEVLYVKANLIANDYKALNPKKSKNLNDRYLLLAAKSLLNQNRNELLIYYNFLKRPTLRNINHDLQKYVQLDQQNNLFALKVELENLILKEIRNNSDSDLTKDEKDELIRDFKLRTTPL